MEWTGLETKEKTITTTTVFLVPLWGRKRAVPTISIDTQGRQH